MHTYTHAHTLTHARTHTFVTNKRGAAARVCVAQEHDLKEVAAALHTEYMLRRRMLLERLRVTLQVSTPYSRGSPCR